MANRFTDQFLDELKDRVRPSDFIGRWVPLKKAGREYQGLSPFNKERTPSFYVNDEKRMFFDFSSGKSGDVIDFLVETQRMSFVEAVEQLASVAGLQVPAADPRAVAQERKRQGLADWLELAAAWFEAELRRPGGSAAREYLERRGLSESETVRFRLGFAPGARTALKDYLIAKGATVGQLVETGLLIQPEDGAAPYDRFRDRIMFPIRDARGRLVSFGGRAMAADARAKYLNGPETAIFHKGAELYGLDQARGLLAADRGDERSPLVVVEGYMDVIACTCAGIPAAAPMGTALTDEQMQALWRFHPEPTLCFDADRAGRQAAARAIDRALPMLKPGRSFRFASAAGGKDPDDVLREQGPAALRAQMAATTPFVEALFIRERDLETLDTPERKAAFKDRLRKLADKIEHKDLADAYRRDLLQRCGKLWAPAPRPRWTPRGERPLEGASDRVKASLAGLGASPSPLSAALATAALRDPGLVDDAIETLSSHGFGDPALARLAEMLVGLRSEGAEVTPAHLKAAGYGPDQVADLERVARRAGVAAPFLAGREDAAALWRQCLEMVVLLAALDVEIGATQDLGRLVAAKAERDALRRRLSSDWTR